MGDDGDGNGEVDEWRTVIERRRLGQVALDTEVQRVGGQREDGRVAASEQASKQVR